MTNHQIAEKFQVCTSVEECETTHAPMASRKRLYEALCLIAEWRDGASMESARAYARAVIAKEKRVAMAKRIETTWECWTYDVLGNAKDGYEVNDRSCFDRHAMLMLTVTVNNPGTPQEFESAYPTDAQIRALFGLGRTKIETDGDDLAIYVTRARDGYPIGEMLCTSHKSLSPIREES